jgi:hypothetical protein
MVSRGPIVELRQSFIARSKHFNSIAGVGPQVRRFARWSMLDRMLRYVRSRGIAFGVLALAATVATISACEQPDQTTTGSASGSTGSDAGVTCGDAICGTNEYCGFAPGACDGLQSCHPFPPCMPEKATCGCDKQDHQSACYADFESGGVLADGTCELFFGVPDGTFPCVYGDQAPIFCSIGSEYCHIQAQPGPYTLSCEPLPAACPPEPADCGCTGDPCAETYCGIDPVDHTITTLCTL